MRLIYNIIKKIKNIIKFNFQNNFILNNKIKKIKIE
jgi:hypothetical protein